MPQKNESSGKTSEKQAEDKLEEKPKTETKPEPEAEPTPAAPSADPVYSVERFLVDGEELTGIPTYILAGALHGRTGDLTVAQAKTATDKFLNAEVQ